MGFGKKMDYHLNREVNLDEIYNKVIKSAFEDEFGGYEILRADEVAGSAVIDINMYTLLMEADLVIANISTLNPNAIYELGIRHALKPYSTIIMANESCRVPFDLNHSRILMYPDYGTILDDEEAQSIKETLFRYVTASESEEVDSPLYSYLPSIIPPRISEQEYDKILKEVREAEHSISNYISLAEGYEKSGEFHEAIRLWERLHGLLPKNDYVIQRWALARYKSEQPSKTRSLEDARLIIMKLNPENSLDTETLGIAGAIHKNLFRINNNFEYLDEAIEYYKRGYVIKGDYYNAENYANCTLLKTQDQELSQEDIIYFNIESKRVRKEVIHKVEENIRKSEADYWMYATLAVSYFHLDEKDQFEKYDKKFIENCSANWEQETYQKTIDEITNILGR